MFRRTLLSLATSLFILTNVYTVYAFHSGGSGALTAEADSQSGSASFGVPIDVPPGRAGIQPNIQLQYNSNLPNGISGVGWSLELGAIQRSLRKGIPSYTDSDEFVLIQSGSSQELVYDSTAGFYRARQEGAFMRIQKSGNAWVVTDKKGTKYHFGATQAAQEYDPNDTSRIFKWALSSVEDLQGNTMTVEYLYDNNKLYPRIVRYTGNAQTAEAPFAYVDILFEARPDPFESRKAGFRQKTGMRIDAINVYAGGVLQRGYD